MIESIQLEVSFGVNTIITGHSFAIGTTMVIAIVLMNVTIIILTFHLLQSGTNLGCVSAVCEMHGLDRCDFDLLPGNDSLLSFA